jgi:hypothetical protein
MYVQYLFHTISILVSYRGRYPRVAAVMIAMENYVIFIPILILYYYVCEIWEY